MNNLIGLIFLFLMPLTAIAQEGLSGNISMPDGSAICDVLVELRDASGEVIHQSVSNENGEYSLGDNLMLGADYSLEFSKGGNVLNGASTFDLVLLFRIILGIDLPNPYALWAADVNGSGQMTTLDMVLIRRLILAVDTELEVPSWAFDEPDAMVPDNRIEIISLDGSENFNVIGVKRGDLNNSANGCE